MSEDDFTILIAMVFTAILTVVFTSLTQGPKYTPAQITTCYEEPDWCRVDDNVLYETLKDQYIGSIEP